VDVNGRVVDTLGIKIDPASDEVRVDGRRVGAIPEHRYLLLNKPRGVVSTRSDPQGRPTVIDLLARAGIHGYFYPVGRLDFDSEGLLILTNDGDFAERVTHPRYEMERTYLAELAGVPEERELDRLRRGVVLDDGRRTLPALVRLVHVRPSRQGPHAVIEITLREGRNRQVRRMCDAIGHPVDHLRRTRIGPIEDRRLKPGHVRELTPDERGRVCFPQGSTGGGQASGAKRRPGLSPNPPNLWKTDPSPRRARTTGDARRRRGGRRP
jgi:pseudouridine synthase